MASHIPFEVVLIDDASDADFKRYNASLSDISNVTYIQLYKNIGRAAIRNLFLKFAKYDYLLFLDCDSEINDNQFISRYINEIKQNKDVICGGRVYVKKPDSKLKQLRWKYGKKRESNLATVRKKMPYNSFLSNNFLIKRTIFEQVNFDERLKNYGHEDTLFGFRLKKAKIQITHIDNPTINSNLEDADLFFENTRNAIKNLHFIYTEIKPENDFKELVKLLNTFVLTRKLYFDKPLALLFGLLKPLFHFLYIKKGYSGLRIFDLYKLGYFCFYSNFGFKKKSQKLN
jgi:glycosyltransferase involved in cell wall biosynthesis